MSFEFVIPVDRDGLLNKTDVNQFVVDEILALREIPGALQDARLALRGKGALSILENFDVFFSILCLQKNVDHDLKEDAWQLCMKVSTELVNHLASVLEDQEQMSEHKQEHLNATKMICYLLCQYMEMLEAEDNKPSTTQIVTAKGRVKSSKKDSMKMDWEKNRESGLKSLLHLVQLNLPRLWDPPIPEEEFVNLVTNCCYKLLENPAIGRITCKETRDSINHVLAVMVKRYNHALGASLKIIQLLQHFEHLVSPLAQTVQLITEEYNVKNVINEVLREIGRMNPRDVSRDTSGTRSFATFLVELAEKVPASILPNISILLCHLNGESYAMRNGILGLMGEIVIKVLSKDDLDSKQKVTREQFMDELEDHIHDCHAFVRSKCLHIWLSVVNEKCLPLHRQENLTKLVIGRLQDKSSQVRRNAIQLITALLKSNPFASKLPVEELQENYEKEKAKLEEMVPHEQAEPIDDHRNEKLQEEWNIIKTKLFTILEDGDFPTENRQSPEDCDSVDSTLERIFVSIVDGMYGQAIQLATAALKTTQDLKNLQHEAQNCEENKENSEVQEDADKSEDTLTENIQKDVLDLIESVFFDFKKNSLVMATEAVASSQESEADEVLSDLTKQQVLVQYLEDSTAFAQQIKEAVPRICHLLGSKSVTDVMEAIEFFVTGFEFGVMATMQGIRRMLLLIWSKEQSVKEAIVAAYKRLYFNPDGGNARSRAQIVVKNLTALIYGATLANISSLEALIMELMKCGELEGTVIQVLWERFTMKLPNTTQEESRAAILLLSMIGSAENEIVKSNIEVLVKEGLGPRAETDFILARHTCTALLKLAINKKLKGEIASEPFRLSETHEIFTRLNHILAEGLQGLENHYWSPLAEQAVNVIYKLAEHPDKICGDLLKQLAKQITDMNLKDKDVERDGQGSLLECPSGVLARVFSLAGQVAFQQLVHLDISVFGEMKRRISKQEEKNNKSKKNAITDTVSKRKDTTNEGIEEELGLTDAAAEDAQSEFIHKICELEIVSGQNLLATFVPPIVEVCKNCNKYSDVNLRAAATLALAKFMMVSSEFCESQLQLLFTVLEKSASATIRANLIIAMGDLSFRFPNLIEPWTPHLYARLRDDSPTVRKNTMQVLTHLILNDMVKVKGQISEMASCLVDDDDRISNLAKVFFYELSKKGNAVYNIMPDVISRLSDPDVGVEEKNFRAIMKVLFPYIQKDKQCESLVEKLCHRYRAARVDRQWRDLSFCLSMLSYSEKSLRKLQENFTCFADKLADDEVYGCFCSIISKSRNFAKPEAKVVIDELEQRIEQCHNKGLEDGDIVEKAGQASSQAATLKNTRKIPGRNIKTPGHKGKGKTSSRRVIDSDDETENVTPAPKRCQRKTARQKPKVSFSSDEESDIELFDVDKSSKSTNQTEDVDGSEDSDDGPLSPKRHVRSSGKGATGRRKHPLLSVNSPV